MKKVYILGAVALSVIVLILITENLVANSKEVQANEGNSNERIVSSNKNEENSNEQIFSSNKDEEVTEPLETATIERSEYGSMSGWIQETKKLLGEATENDFFHLGASTSIYARHYMEQTENVDTKETLEKISDVGIEVVNEINKDKQEDLLKRMYDLLEEIG